MTSAPPPVLLWLRRDFRLSDNPALAEALALARANGSSVIPVFLLDEVVEDLGAAPKWRLGLAAEAFDATLRTLGARLTFRKGQALNTLRALVAETGAERVIWTRAYTPDQIERDKTVKAGLKSDGLHADSIAGHLMFEPWTVETGSGSFYKVYTPFWKAVREREPGAPLPAPTHWPVPASWPTSEPIADWQLGRAMNRGAAVVRPHLHIGEAAAQNRLDSFLDGPIKTYVTARDLPSVDGTSGLSENLAYGEISPRTIWAAGQRALHEGAAGAETFLKELVWREFAYHLAYHTPHIQTRNWREEWDGFPWQGDSPQAERWRQGRTGVPFVDAAMRQLYITGTMHNRGRMIVASYLTKHLMTDWRVGLAWFADTLVDWDPAANAMGWQWAAGSGPDAAPYFRIFNPETQLDKFDKPGRYAARYLAEGQLSPDPTALSFYDAIPKRWGLSPRDLSPKPMISLAAGRERALAAYKAHRTPSDPGKTQP